MASGSGATVIGLLLGNSKIEELKAVEGKLCNELIEICEHTHSKVKLQKLKTRPLKSYFAGKPSIRLHTFKRQK